MGRYNNYRERNATYNNARNYDEKPKKKRSSCTKKNVPNKSTGEIFTCIYGWNVSKRKGLVTFVASPAKKGITEGTSKNGRSWVRFVVKIEHKNSFSVRTISGFWYADKNQLVMREIGMVANPSKSYFGGYNNK